MRRLSRLFLMAGLVVSTSACNTLDDAMVAVFGRSMRDQSTFDPYEHPLMPAEGAVSFSSGNFPADRHSVMLGAAEPRDYDIPDFTNLQTPNPEAEVWSTFSNPVPADAESLERGEVLYERYCAVCHGTSGIGAESNLVEVWPVLPAYNLAMDPVSGYSDSYIYAMIRVGRALMPAYGHQITHFDRWNIVNYVRKLQADQSGGASVSAGEG